MATFTAIYREASTGRRQAITITATSRAAAYAALAAKGIHPLKLEEGGSGNQATPAAVRAGWRMAVWAAIFAGCAVTAWWLWPTAGSVLRPVGDPSPSRPSVPISPSSKTPKAHEPGRTPIRKGERPAVSTARRGDGRKPPETAEAAGSADDSPSEVPETPKWVIPIRRGSDQLIAMAIFQPRDVPMPPMPGMGPGDTQAFLDSLAAPIELPEDASETLKAMREAVLEVRADIAKALKADPKASVQSILEGHRKLHNENIDIRAQAQKELDSILQTGDADAVKKYLDEVNPVLCEMGIEEVGLPEDGEQAEESAPSDPKP